MNGGGDEHDVLSGYLDGELTAAERAEVEAQLAASPELRAELEEVRMVRDAVRALPRHDAPAGYWDAVVEQPDPPLSEGDTVDRVRELFSAAVEKRMMSDVPFGVFLSGGVDSSATVAMMARFMDRPVRTFTVGFEGESPYNELEHARRAAREFGADHHEVVISQEDAISFLPEMVFHQDEPIAGLPMRAGPSGSPALSLISSASIPSQAATISGKTVS